MNSLTVNKIFSQFKKKYSAITVVSLFVLINIMATLRLGLSVVYPERVLKEVVSEYFKNNLNKAVKFEDIYIDYDGTIVISDFNVSITSDFNDNISLIRSNRAIINLSKVGLVTGSIRVKGIDFYNSEITFIKKYGRSHIDSFLMVFDPEKFIQKTQHTYGEFYIDFHRARLNYRESLKAKQVAMELDKIDAEFFIDRNTFTYAAEGRIKPFRAEGMRRGHFDCKGSVNIKNYTSYKHRIIIDNFDLSYCNDHIAEYKNWDVALQGGISIDAEISKSKKILSIHGGGETNNMSVHSVSGKYSLLSNENLNLTLDMSYHGGANRIMVNQFKLNDDVFTLDGSGTYARNAKEDMLKLKFKTNQIDLADLSQNFTPYKNIEYGGILQGEGGVFLDFKAGKASDMHGSITLDRFTLSRRERGNAVPLVDESTMRVSVKDSSIGIDISGRPLQSDLAVKSRTRISGWIPFKSDTDVTVQSKKMNIENLKNSVVFIINSVFTSAYEDKRSATEKVPFLQSPLGKFMNNNTITLKSRCDNLFCGKKARISDFTLDAQLIRGSVLINEFQMDGYDAKYKLSFQGYFNSDQPYVKIEGKVDDFDLGSFYADTGQKGAVTGKGRTDFSFEVSAARIGDLLDNAKGNLNIYIGKGEMRNTPAQQAIMKFLRKNGYDASPLSHIEFEDITSSISEQGENFWFSNVSVRGDTLLFSALGDYLFEGGINSSFSATIRKEATATTIPLRLHGPLLSPCLDVANRKDSHKECF